MLDDRFYVSRGPLAIADLIEGLEVSLPDPKFLDEQIAYPAPLKGAGPQSIVFLGSKKNIAHLAACNATACFVTDALSVHVGAQHIIPLITKTPRAHFARAMSLLGAQMNIDDGATAYVSDTARVHPSAVIGAGARLGPDVVVGPNSVIGAGVELGDTSEIGPNVTIEAAIIGVNCTIKAGAVIGGRGFGVDHDANGLIDIPHFGRVIIGDNVSIGANSCIDRGQLGDTVLGNNVKLDNLVQIGHNVSIGNGSRLAAQVGISGSCIIGQDVMIGGSVGMADHIEIGDNAHIAGRAGVMRNIPAGQYWGGTPAQPMKDFMREVAVTRKLARRPKKDSDET